MNSVPVITYLLKQIVHDMYDIIFLTIIESNTKKTSANRNYVLMISTISTLKQSSDNQKPLDGKAMNSKDFKVQLCYLVQLLELVYIQLSTIFLFIYASLAHILATFVTLG